MWPLPLGKPLLDALDRMGYGGLVLDGEGQISRLNDTARGVLSGSGSLESSGMNLQKSREALKGLLRSRESTRFRMDESDWVLVRREDVRPLILRAIRIDDDGANSGPHTVVILVDLETVPHPTVTALQKIFDLSPAEARVAIEIGCGKSADEIAEATQVSVETVRTQLKAVLAKTSTHRQAELVALMARVSILP